MENVVAFNTELSGLYDTKPPISKAKMAAITRSAMKAIKFYKHVVQSVEKFILKCKPEYKIPGLYVIDSIVRQSRHQFGPEKDVFAPRFARNMKQTFANLFRCAPEDKSRIIRVLNLWQKNQVFAPEVIQPLFDLADPNHPIYQMQAQNMQDISSISNGLNTSGSEANTSNVADENHGKSQDIGIGHQTANTLDQSSIRQLQQLQQIFMRQANENSSGTGANQSDSVKFNKKLLDYDYGEDEEEEKSTSPRIPNLLDGNNLTQLLKDPNVLRQLQTLQKLKQQEEKQMKLNEMKIQEEAFEKHLQNVLKGTSGGPSNTINNQQVQDMPEKEIEFVTEDDKIEVINLDGNDSRSTTPDRDRYKRRRTSRSRSRDRGRDRDRRRRSRSRSRNSRSPKTNRRRASRERKDKEREKEKEKEKEYERERRRKGLPDIKKEHLSVCSTTLWVGHLSKLVQQEELSDTFGKYGDIVSIDMIHPRGCAFIVMNRRQDAHKAMGSLKNHKLQGRAITISWAAGKGVKSKEWKDYWDLDLGVSFIPWNKLSRDTDLETLEEGGMFDEDSMPEWMKDKINQKKEHKEKGITMYGMEGIPNVDTSQPPPPTGTIMSGVPMVPPFPMGPVPRLMPPMGVPMPGNMVPQMGMPPNMVPGMPPPHMMLPPGGMVPGFPPIPPPMDKSMPPPNNNNSSDGPNNLPPPFMGNMGQPPHMAHHQGPMFGGNMGMPPQFQQPPNNASSSNSISNPNDDHMDIEMEDEAPANVKPLPQINFNQPPPIFGNFSNDNMQRGNDNRQNDREMMRGDRRDNDYRDHSRDRDLRDHDLRSDFKNRENRDRNRGPWGSDHDLSEEREHPQQHREVVKFGNDRDIMSESIRADFNPMGPGLDQGSNRQDLPQIWRDNNVPVANFNQHPPNFNDNMRGRGMSIPPPIDMNNPPPPPHHIRPPHEFFDIRRENKDFNQDDRRPPSGGMQRDFFPNIGNRFGPPQGVVRGGMPPMRGGPPPPQFAPRLGPMFIRGPPHPGPPAAPFNFNDRPPFEREDRGRMRGNNMGDRRGRGNWRDDDDGGGNNRRGNRFQNRDRDGFDREDRKRDRNDRDRNDRDRDRDSRNRNSRDRSDRDRGGDRQFNNRENRENKDSSRNRFSEPAREEEPAEESYVQPPQPPKLTQDTEEDWDLELSDHNIGTANENQKQQEQGDSNINDDFSQDDFKGFDSQQQQPENFPDESNDNARSFNDDFQQRAEEAISSNEDEDTFAVPTKANEQESEKPFAHVNTPLYDELPGQKPEIEEAAAVEEPCSEPSKDTEATND